MSALPLVESVSTLACILLVRLSADHSRDRTDSWIPHSISDVTGCSISSYVIWQLHCTPNYNGIPWPGKSCIFQAESIIVCMLGKKWHKWKRLIAERHLDFAQQMRNSWACLLYKLAVWKGPWTVKAKFPLIPSMWHSFVLLSCLCPHVWVQNVYL